MWRRHGHQYYRSEVTQACAVDRMVKSNHWIRWATVDRSWRQVELVCASYPHCGKWIAEPSPKSSQPGKEKEKTPSRGSDHSYSHAHFSKMHFELLTLTKTFSFVFFLSFFFPSILFFFFFLTRKNSRYHGKHNSSWLPNWLQWPNFDFDTIN